MENLEEMRVCSIEAVKSAGQVVMSYYGRIDKEEAKQGPRSYVTAAEIAKGGSDSTIQDLLRKRFPQHQILSEESGKSGPKSDYLWIIDPLCGTINFLNRIPFFVVSLALAKDRETILGIIYDPYHRELFWAEKGKGCYLNDKRIFVSDDTQLIDAVVSYSLYSSYLNDKRKERKIEKQELLSRLISKVCGLRSFNTSNLDLPWVADGRFGAAVFLSLNSKEYWQPWDFAAGTLMVCEAGGKTTDFCGKPFDPFSSKSLIASNGSKLHDQLLKIVNTV